MSNKVGLTLKSKFDNGRSVSGGGAVFHTERLRKEDRLNLKTAPNTITLYRHGLEEVDKKDQKAVYGYFHNLENSIKQDYQKHSHRNRKWQDKNELFYEGIIAFGRDKFEKVNNPQQIMEYCTNYCNLLEEKTGAKIHMVSLHLDEGHLNEEGQLQHNYHAHFLLVNYNETTHKSALRNAKILADEYRTEIKTYTTKSGETKQKTVKTKEPTGNQIEVLYDFKQIQNDLGKHFAPLGFERGRDYAAEGLKCPKNIDHNSYTKLKIAEQEHLNELINDVNKELMPILDFAEENKLSTNTPLDFIKELKAEILDKKDQIIASFRQEIATKTLEIAELKALYDKTRAELIASKEAKQPDYQQLKKDYEVAKRNLEDEIGHEIRSAKEKGFKAYEERLIKENSGIAKKTLLKALEKPSTPLFLDTQISEPTQQKLEELLSIKQKIEKIPLRREVIVKQEKLIETPKYVEKEVIKTVEKTVVIDIDENISLKTNLDAEKSKNASLKTKIEELEKDLRSKTGWMKTLELLLQSNRDRNAEFQSKLQNQDLTLKSQEEQINRLSDENSTLRIENKALLSAIESFLSLGIVKSTLKGTKTLLERFSEAVDNLKTLLTKNVEPKQEIEPDEPNRSYGRSI